MTGYFPDLGEIGMVRTKTRLAAVLMGSFGATATLAGPAAATAPSPSPHDAALATAVIAWFTGGGDKRIAAIQTRSLTTGRPSPPP